MSNIDKQVLCVPKRKKHAWGEAVMHTCDFCDHYAMTITTENGEHSCANCCDAEYVGALTCALEMAIDRAEVAQKRVAELEAREKSLRTVGVMSQKAFQRLEGREARFIALWPRPEIYLPRKRPKDSVIVYARVSVPVKEGEHG
ncbi:hypothetical protein [Enterobacter ludwigii]|uniref:hypothetical protein n=1 Tax=Enterobacter ludwigii TaxID=299767 RepID=UPI002FF98AD3